MTSNLARLVDRVHRQPELTAVWVLMGLVCVAIVVTYSRLPADVLYNVTGSGLSGGLSRLVVFLGFPVSLIALAVLPVAYDLAATHGRRPGLVSASIASLALCMTIGIPGVIEEDDLDAKWVNGLAVIGVGLALAVTVAALRSDGPAAPGWSRWDTGRVIVALALLVAGLPWIAAELGFYLPGDFFLTGQDSPFAGEGGTGIGPAVHHGDHHGLIGVELALVAIALFRVVPRMAPTWRRPVTAGWLSLMLVYGLTNAVQDFWLEQVVKRGWTDDRIPSMLRPKLTPAWAAVVVVAALVYVLAFHRRRRRPEEAIIVT
jgi:hypothetical protein